MKILICVLLMLASGGAQAKPTVQSPLQRAELKNAAVQLQTITADIQQAIAVLQRLETQSKAPHLATVKRILEEMGYDYAQFERGELEIVTLTGEVQKAQKRATPPLPPAPTPAK
jgi:hypothetical protein